MAKVRRKIIHVDDVNYNLMTMKDRLKKHYEVYPAKNTAKLDEYLDNFLPDLILLDINMPDTDGFELIKQLKTDHRTAFIPVIFLTAKKGADTITKAMNLGAADIVFKPVTNEVLRERIEAQFNITEQTATKPIILAVDDDPSILRTIHGLLNEEYTVYTLPHPTALKETLAQIEPDLFLLDCHMPDMSGLDLVPKITALPEHENTPIIFLTADASNKTVRAAISTGARGFIIKPIDEEKLREQMSLHLKDYMTRRLVRSYLASD